MSECEAHLMLKMKGEQLLLNKGFKKNEIVFEYFLKLPDDNFAKVDVAGFHKGKKVFIECGNITKKNKLKLLARQCDTLIHLPYLTSFKRKNDYTVLPKFKKNYPFNWIATTPSRNMEIKNTHPPKRKFRRGISC